MIIMTDLMVAAYQLSEAESSDFYKTNIIPLLDEVCPAVPCLRPLSPST